MTPHDGPTEKGRQRRRQEPMVTPRDRSGNGSGRIAAESIGDQPLPGQEQIARRVLGAQGMTLQTILC